MAAIGSRSRRSSAELPAWAGTVGLVLGSAVGAAACYALTTLV